MMQEATSETQGMPSPGIRTAKAKSFRKSLRKDSSLYLLALPGIIILILFAYLPMSGLILVFKNYNFNDGIFGSPWAYLISSFSSLVWKILLGLHATR